VLVQGRIGKAQGSRPRTQTNDLWVGDLNDQQEFEKKKEE